MMAEVSKVSVVEARDMSDSVVSSTILWARLPYRAFSLLSEELMQAFRNIQRHFAVRSTAILEKFQDTLSYLKYVESWCRVQRRHDAC